MSRKRSITHLGQQSSQQLPAKPPRASYYELVVSWPATHHRVQKIRDAPHADFTVHGFWHSKESTGNAKKRASFANNKTTDYDAGKSPHNVDQFFVSLKGKGGIQPTLPLPEHEWKRHGKFSPLRFKQLLYFQTAIDKFTELKVLASLKSNGISPSDSIQYPLSRIREAFPEKNPIIDCTTGMLSSIRFCVDETTYKLVDFMTVDSDRAGEFDGSICTLFPETGFTC